MGQRTAKLLTNAKGYILNCIKKCFKHWFTSGYYKKRTVRPSSDKHYLVISDIFYMYFSF